MSSARPKKSRATARTAGSSSQPCTERSGWKWRSARAAESAPKLRTAREERRERGEGVEVGGGERAAAGAAGEREGVDVAGVVEEEEAGAGQRVARGARGHVGDADVVVRGPDVGDELELVGEGLDTRGSCCGGGGAAAGAEDWAAAWEWIWHRQRHRRHGNFVCFFCLSIFSYLWSLPRWEVLCCERDLCINFQTI